MLQRLNFDDLMMTIWSWCVVFFLVMSCYHQHHHHHLFFLFPCTSTSSSMQECLWHSSSSWWSVNLNVFDDHQILMMVMIIANLRLTGSVTQMADTERSAPPLVNTSSLDLMVIILFRIIIMIIIMIIAKIIIIHYRFKHNGSLTKSATQSETAIKSI